MQSQRKRKGRQKGKDKGKEEGKGTVPLLVLSLMRPWLKESLFSSKK
jgi:predicted transposase YdaD